MRLYDLKSLIEFASVQAEKFFRRNGVLYLMYHCIKADGETAILTPPPDCDKDTSVALMKAWFAIENVDRYVFMDEAWIVDDRRGQIGLDIAKVKREGVRNHPERREIVLFSAENIRGEQLMATRFILRPEVGKPKLSPLKIDEPFDHSEGRMVGMLNWSAVLNKDASE
jgi:hypothetical protein